MRLGILIALITSTGNIASGYECQYFRHEYRYLTICSQLRLMQLK